MRTVTRSGCTADCAAPALESGGGCSALCGLLGGLGPSRGRHVVSCVCGSRSQRPRWPLEGAAQRRPRCRGGREASAWSPAPGGRRALGSPPEASWLSLVPVTMAPVRVSLRSSQRRLKWLSRVSSSPSCVPAPGGVAVAGGSERPDRGPGRSGQSRGGPSGSRSPCSHALLWPLLTTRRPQSAADPAVPGFPRTRRRPRVRGPSRCAGACRPPGCDPEGVPPAPASAPPAWAPVFSKRSRAGHGCHSGGGTRCARRVLRRFRSGRLGPELARVTAASALLWNCGARSPPPG